MRAVLFLLCVNILASTAQYGQATEEVSCSQTTALVLARERPVDEDDDEDEVDDTNDNSSDDVIAIDLGTTSSCVGIFKDGRVEIIPNDFGNRVTPSYVAFTSESERFIGEAAKNQLTNNPENTIFDVKRMIGRTWGDKSLQNNIKSYPFKVINKNNTPYVDVQSGGETKVFAAEEISAMILTKMREVAEAYLGKKISNAVITVPAYFNDAQRQATKDAGVIAGLNVMRIINKPSAAAIAYGFDKTKGEKNILVLDLGGRTFDVSVVNIDYGVQEVLATNGDAHLGGEYFNQRVVEYLTEKYKENTGNDIRKDKRAVQKLLHEVEKAKRALSSQHQTKIEVQSMFDGEDFAETLTRDKFEELNMDLFRSTVKSIKQVLEDAHLRTDEHIDEIVLVGGSSRIPKIQQLVKEFFDGKEPISGMNPDEAVVSGAAVVGDILSSKEDVMDLWIMCDLTPLSLGIETASGAMATLILRNSAIPTKKSQIYTTGFHGQTSLTIRVFEGERLMAKDNHFLGQFVLTGILPLPRGVPQINVTFEIDVNGILTVYAEEKDTGQNTCMVEKMGTTKNAFTMYTQEIIIRSKNKIVIQNYQNELSYEDVHRMVEDAGVYADDDSKAIEKSESKYNLKTFAYLIKARINDGQDDLGGKIYIDEKEQMKEAVDEVIRWLERNQDASLEEYIKQMNELRSLCSRLSVIVTSKALSELGMPKIA